VKVRVGKRGVVVIPKSVREMLGIKEGAILELEVVGEALVLRARDLWEELRRRGSGARVDVDAFERELDEAGEEWLEGAAGSPAADARDRSEPCGERAPSG